MVATRSSGRASQVDSPQKHATVGGRVAKPKAKKATKAKKRPSAPVIVEDLEFESKLMKEVGRGEVSLQECRRQLQSQAQR